MLVEYKKPWLLELNSETNTEYKNPSGIPIEFEFEERIYKPIPDIGKFIQFIDLIIYLIYIIDHMEKIGNHLVNAYIKIRNPLMLRPNSVNHECNPNDFEFKSQQKKYDLLKASLEPYNIVLTKVYATRWSTCNNLAKPDKYVFVVESNSPIVWYKYESDGYGSGQLISKGFW